VRVEMVSQAYFGILGITPRLGRFFAPDEDLTPNAHPVAVLSERLWRSTFGADPGVLGRTIRLDATPFVVVGASPGRVPRPVGPGGSLSADDDGAAHLPQTPHRGVLVLALW
jgi:hypothetical protein